MQTTEQLTAEVAQLRRRVAELEAGLVPMPIAWSGSALVEWILERVATAHALSVEELLSRSRRERLVRPRLLAMYLVREHTDWSLATIAERFGRSYSAIAWAHKTIADTASVDPTLDGSLKHWRDQLPKMIHLQREAELKNQNPS